MDGVEHPSAQLVNLLRIQLGIGGDGFVDLLQGHAEYRKNVKTSSLDFGLVDVTGKDSPYQPTESHSRAPYFYR